MDRQPQRHSWVALLKMRNFRLLWAAGVFSALSDQFDLVVFPWLVLLVTADPLAVGGIIAVSSVPTVLLLVGGSLMDRFDARRIMQATNLARVVIGLVLGMLLLAGADRAVAALPVRLVEGDGGRVLLPGAVRARAPGCSRSSC